MYLVIKKIDFCMYKIWIYKKYKMISFLCCFTSKSNKQIKLKQNPISSNVLNEIKLDIKEIKKFDLNGITGNFYVESVYDGDTITILIPINTHIYNMISSNQIDESSDSNSSNITYLHKVRLRLLGIDTPEMKPSKDLPNRQEHIEKAKAAKEFLSGLVLNKIIRVEFLSNDKYGRPLCKIYSDSHTQSLNDLMVTKGFAKKYDGGTKDTEF